MLASIQAFANTIGANSCLLCKMVKVSEYGLCDACQTLLPHWYPRCLKHLAEAPSQSLVTTAEYWFAPLRWSVVTRNLVHRYKGSQQDYLSQPMALWLAAHVYRCYQQLVLPWPDLVVAMPATSKTWQQRGFHHTGLLARQVAAQLQLPYQAGLLRIIRLLPKQKQLNRGQRWQAAAGSQYCTDDVAGKTIAVIDDLISSGATLSAAAQALKKRGAKQVHGWALIYNAGD